MDALVAALDRGHRWSRRRWYALTGVAVGGGVLGIAWGQFGTKPPACEQGSELLADVWSVAHAERMEAAATARSPSFGSAAARAVIPRLDAYAAEWIAAHASTCESSGDSGSGDTSDTRTLRCLERRRLALARAVALLTGGDPETLLHASQITSTLPRVAECIEGGSTRSNDESLGLDELQLLVDVDRVRLDVAAGRFQDAATLSADVVGRDSAAKTTRAAAEAWQARALATEKLGRHETAEAAFLASFRRAYELDDQRIVLAVAAGLVAHFTQWAPDEEQSRTWEMIASVAEARATDPGMAVADLLEARGFMERRFGRIERAVEFHAAAVEFLERWHDRDAMRLAQAKRQHANALDLSGKADEAREVYEAVRSATVAIYGEWHPDVASVEVNLGIQDLNRAMKETEGEHSSTEPLGAAEEHFESALAIQRAAFGEDSPRTAAAMTGLANVALHQGQFAQARNLAERAWELEQAGLPANHPARGNALAVLASALAFLDDPEHALAVHDALRREGASKATAEQRRQIEQNIGYLLCEVDRCVEARPFAERVLLETEDGDPIHHYADGLLARVELAEGAPKAAEHRARRVIRESATWIPSDTGQKAEMYYTLALALEASGGPRAEILDAARIAQAGFVEAGYGANALATLERLLGAR